MTRRNLTRYTGTTGGTRRYSPRAETLIASVTRILHVTRHYARLRPLLRDVDMPHPVEGVRSDQLMRQPLLALAALSLTLNTTGTTMAAERVYGCDRGAFVTYLSGPREMRVSMPGTDGWAIAMPLAIEGDHVVVWSPHGENSVDKNYAPKTPYVVQTFHEGQWFPNGTASETNFDLGTGEVQCALVR